MPVERISFMPSSCLSLTNKYTPISYSLPLGQSGICGRQRPQKWTKGGSYSRCFFPFSPQFPPVFPSSPYPTLTQAKTSHSQWLFGSHSHYVTFPLGNMQRSESFAFRMCCPSGDVRLPLLISLGYYFSSFITRLRDGLIDRVHIRFKRKQSRFALSLCNCKI